MDGEGRSQGTPTDILSSPIVLGLSFMQRPEHDVMSGYWIGVSNQVWKDTIIITEQHRVLSSYLPSSSSSRSRKIRERKDDDDNNLLLLPN
jgi:hypothetical protein